MSTTANMSLVMPVEKGSSGAWDALLNTIFGVVDAHDHSAGKGVLVPTAGLNINANLPMGDFGLTGVGQVAFSQVGALTTGSTVLFVGSPDGELYWRTVGGTNVKLTAANALNVAAFVGGIGGDYSSVSALLDYDDATDTYRFRQELSATVRQYAKIGVADIVLREYDPAGDATVPANTITIKSPDALAASYSVTWPAAVPAAAAAVQSSTAGVLTFSNTFTQNITAPDLRYTTAQGDFHQGSLWQDPNGAHTKLLSSAGAHIGWTLGASASKLTMPLRVREGDTITSYRCWVHKDTSSAATVSCKLWKQRISTLGTESAVSLGTLTETSAQNSPGYGVALVPVTLGEVVAVGFQYYAVFTPSASVTPAADGLLGLELFKTRP